MIIVELLEAGKAAHVLARVSTVKRARTALDEAYAKYDGTIDGVLQATSDQTGYVHDERTLYRYDRPALTTPTESETDAARNIGAPVGETPRYSEHATLTFLDPEGWFVVWGNEVHPYGRNYSDALAAWERVSDRSNI